MLHRYVFDNVNNTTLIILYSFEVVIFEDVRALVAFVAWHITSRERVSVYDFVSF